MSSDKRSCLDCGIGPLEAVQTSFHVNKDASPDEPEIHLTLEIDRCPICGGIWFDPHELERYLAPLDKAAAPKKIDLPEDAKLKSVKCPKCGIPMAQSMAQAPRLGKKPRLINHCPFCLGIWLTGNITPPAAPYVSFGDELPEILRFFFKRKL